MTHRYILGAAALAAVAPAAWAQSDALSRPLDEPEEGLIETVAKVEKKTDKFNLYLNMHGDFAAKWKDATFDNGRFEMKQLRIEAKGNINDWLSYRYRQRLNKGDSPNGYYDNVMQSIDIAGIGLKLGKFNLFLGKQCASYGGIQFDLNPIEIYQYCDMIDYMTNFMTGINVAYNPTPNQQIQFQVLNALVKSSKDTYGNYERSKLPLVYTLNWNGNFNDVFQTRWSASVMNETKKKNLYYFALGNKFNISEKVGMYVDWMYARENVDRLGIITEIMHPDGGAERNAMKTDYMSTIVHFDYRFLPAWNLFVEGMYDTAGIYKGYGDVKKGNYRTTWSYTGGVEFYPMKDRNLHFFLAYTGQSYKFTDRARLYGNDNYTTNRLSLGFIWQMPIF